MRTALLMCGQPRTFEFCFSSLKQHLLDVYQPDIFICTDSQEERVRELYQPVAMEVISSKESMEKGIILRQTFDHWDAIPEPVISVGYKFMRCVELKKAHELEGQFTYDVVIVTRFDIRFASVQPIGPVEENVLYVPLIDAYPVVSEPTPGLHWGGYSAHLCWMSSNVANMLPETYFAPTNWLKLATEAKEIWGQNPEHVLKFFCDHNGIHAEFVEINMMLIRGTSENPLGWDHKPISAYPQFA